MKFSMTGKLYVNVLGYRTHWPCFRPKFCKIYKSSMKGYSQNIGKILAKINIIEHILQIFCIKFINVNWKKQ